MLTTCHLRFLSYTHAHTFGSPWAVFACCCLSWALVSSLESRIWMILEQLSDHSAASLTGRGSDSKNWGSKTCLRLELNPCLLFILCLENVFFSIADFFHKPSTCFHAVVSSADVTGPVVCSLFTFYVLCAAPLWCPIRNKTTDS